MSKLMFLLLILIAASCNQDIKKESIQDPNDLTEDKFNNSDNIYDIIPLTDGKAYAISSYPKSKMWYLIKNKAFLVEEVKNAIFMRDNYGEGSVYPETLSTNLEKFLWTQLQIEKEKVKRLNADKDE